MNLFMSQLSVDSLVRSHDDHDSFVRTYVKTNNDEDSDCVVIALQKRLQSVPRRNKKPNLYKFVARELENRPVSVNEETQRIRHLALYILLTQYPEQWKDMFDAAYKLLLRILGIICLKKQRGRAPKPGPIYPPRWTQQIFRLEKFLAPRQVQGIIFGVDPISKDSNSGNAATGYAFTFDYQPDMTNFAPSPTRGLLEAYCLKKARDYAINSRHLEQDLMQHGIGMVNFIRTIKQKSLSGSANVFVKPWIAYNKTWLEHLHEIWRSDDSSCIDSDRVLIFQNEHYPFDDFVDTENDPNPDDFKAVKDLLEKVPRCSHPSYIRANVNHCLVKPSTFYKWYPRYGLNRDSIDDKRCNESVIKFVAFLRRREATKAIHCQCIVHRDKAQEDLFEDVQATTPRDSESDQEPIDLNQTGNTTTLSTSDLPIALTSLENSFAKMGITDSHSTNTSTDSEATDQPSPDTSTDVVFAAVESPDISAIENDHNDDNQMPEGSEDGDFE